MSLILGFKIVLVPTLIAAVTLAGRRWGPSIAGWLSGFPIVTGPILLFIAIEQGPDFGAAAALGTLLGLPAILVFNLVYAWSATGSRWPLSLSAALLAYAGAAWALITAAPSTIVSIVLAAIVLLLGPRLFPGAERNAETTPRIGGRAAILYQILYRMLAAAALVAAVTHFAAALGPQRSGLFAMFPVISIVLAAFSHHSVGPAFVASLLKSVILGWYALALFSLLLTLLLPQTHFAIAFVTAGFGAIGVQLVSRRFIRR